MLINCPVTPEDVGNSNSFFGPGVSPLKIKTTSKSSDSVVTEYVEVTQVILDLNKKLTLAEYFLFVNWLYLFVST